MSALQNWWCEECREWWPHDSTLIARLRVRLGDGRMASGIGACPNNTLDHTVMLRTQDAVALDDARAEIAFLRQRLNAGADPTPVPANSWPTAGQWVAHFLDADGDERLQMASRALGDAGELARIASGVMAMEQQMRADRVRALFQPEPNRLIVPGQN